MAFTGSCYCGSTRYWCASAPSALTHCHCRACRKAGGGTAFATFADVAAADVHWIHLGTALDVRRTSALARRGFCGACGSAVFMQYDCEADSIGLCAGTIDDDGQEEEEEVGKEGGTGAGGEVGRREEGGEEEGRGGEEAGSLDVTVDDNGGSGAGGGARRNRRKASRSRMGRWMSSSAGDDDCKDAGTDGSRDERVVSGDNKDNVEEDESGGDHNNNKNKSKNDDAMGLLPVGRRALPRPSAHIFTQEKASWYDITDGLPQYRQHKPEMQQMINDWVKREAIQDHD
jgi:hypothetical protein